MQLRATRVDLERRTVERDGESVRLTTTEARLLMYLADRAGQDVTREELLSEVWGYAPGVYSRTVDTTVRRLRAKVEADRHQPDHILSVHGVGYRFVGAARGDLNSLADKAALAAELLRQVQDAAKVGDAGRALDFLARAKSAIPGIGVPAFAPVAA